MTAQHAQLRCTTSMRTNYIKTLQRRNFAIISTFIRIIKYCQAHSAADRRGEKGVRYSCVCSQSCGTETCAGDGNEVRKRLFW